MNRYPSPTQRMNSRTSAFRNAPTSFKIMFTAVTLLIAAGFVLTLAFLVSMLVSGEGYSYEVNYRIGNSEYSESYNYNN